MCGVEDEARFRARELIAASIGPRTGREVLELSSLSLRTPFPRHCVRWHVHQCTATFDSSSSSLVRPSPIPVFLEKENLSLFFGSLAHELDFRLIDEDITSNGGRNPDCHQPKHDTPTAACRGTASMAPAASDAV